MAKWTELQKAYVKDIEKNLKIVYDGDKSKKSASEFIKKHKKENYEYEIKHGLRKPYTGYRIFVSISKESLQIINDHYLKESMFSEEDVEGEWNNFVEGLI
jgi:hypothetical protein